MTAVPRVYPVTIACPGGFRLAESLKELVRVRGLHESTGRATLFVVARDRQTAESRAKKATGRQVVEVGEPTPLQKFSKAKALPYRRSFVFGRHKPGRFDEKGGSAAFPAARIPQPRHESRDATLRIRFESQRDRDKAVARVMQFTESCDCTRDVAETEAEFDCGCHRDEAIEGVSDALRRLGIRNFSVK